MARNRANNSSNNKQTTRAQASTKSGIPEVMKDVNTSVSSQIPVTPPPPEIDTDPYREYVSAGGYAWLPGYYRSLPHHVDDTTRDFGYDLYKRMQRDPQVSSSFNLLKLSILGQGLTLVGAVQSEEDEDYEYSNEILEFSRRQFSRLDKPIIQTLYEVLDAMAYGHKVAEKVFEIPTEGEDANKICLKAIKTKPQQSVAFVVDAFMNVLGLLGLVPGMGASLNTLGVIGTIINDGEGKQWLPTNLLAREKFMVFTFNPEDSDPRGTSIFRAAYNAWWLKMQVWPEYLKYLAAFAVASLIGKPPPGKDQVAIKNADGTITYVSPVSAMLTALQDFKNGSVLAVPSGAEVDVVQPQGNGEAFQAAIDMFNREILVAIVHQTLATGEGQHMARAASQTHQDVLSMVIDFAKGLLEECIFNELLKQLVRLNFGDDAAEKFTPKASLSETEKPDFPAVATAIASLWTSGYLDKSQQPGLDAMLSLPARDLEAIAREEEQKLQLAQQIASGSGAAAGANDGNNADNGSNTDNGQQPGQDQGSQPQQSKQPKQTSNKQGKGNK